MYTIMLFELVFHILSFLLRFKILKTYFSKDNIKRFGKR